LPGKALAYWTHSHARKRSAVNTAPGANVSKLFAAVIYSHFMALLLFCVKKQYNSENYHRMAVNYHDKKFHNIGPWWKTLIPK
jgi:hypothetical protein